KRGLRIDHIWVTKKLNALVKDSGIDYEIRGMEKPSDHAPIWTTFDL
ncbi:MAG: exodeoxyribonuclease III, partial [Balneola sp.]|nr:exodeoxyribonuclease III [Balneola sp.]